MKNKDKAKISYEHEADVLMWESTDKNRLITPKKSVMPRFILPKNNMPVLIEILKPANF